MPITFSCPCGRQLQVGDEYAGKRARCPECDAVVGVPTADAPPPLPSEAPPLARPSKRAKLAEPDETDDEVGATAGSLDPTEGRSRRSERRDEDEGDGERPRRRRLADTDDEDEDDRPRRRRHRNDDDEDEDGYRSLRRPRRPDPPRKFWNNKVTGGLACMVIAVLWFCGGLAFDVLFYYPPILFVVGIVSVIRGLASGRD